MKIVKTSFIAFCLVSLSNFATPALALPDEPCFESRLDYEIYWIREVGVKGNHNGEIELEEDRNSWLKRAEEHGPSRMKPVTINVVEENNSSHGFFYLDASASTTVSGEILFNWDPPASANAKTQQSAKLQVSQGSRSSVKLTVIDPVCETMGSRTIAVPKR